MATTTTTRHTDSGGRTQVTKTTTFSNGAKTSVTTSPGTLISPSRLISVTRTSAKR